MITHLKIRKTKSQLKGSYTVQETDTSLKLIRTIALRMRDSHFKRRDKLSFSGIIFLDNS